MSAATANRASRIRTPTKSWPHTSGNIGRGPAVTTDRLPPQNREAERAVLGSMLRDNRVIDDVQTIIHANDFYFDAHQKIFSAIITPHAKGQPVDLLLLAQALNDAGQLADIGRAAYLAELWEAAP